MTDNLLMFSPDELPQTDEPKRKPRVNCLQDMLIEIMNERGLKDAEIVKATNIPWATFHGWVSGEVSCQLADQNLLRLAQFLNVSLEYLVYGIGDDDPYFNKFDGDIA